MSRISCGRELTAVGIVVVLASGGSHLAAADGGIWDEEQLFFASDPAIDDYFGYAVATDGTTAMVGVIYDDDDGPPLQGNAGSVRVFERSGSLWTEVARLVPIDEINSGFFGAAIAIDGDTAVIGSYGRDLKKGAAYVFVREPGGWVEQDKLFDPDSHNLDNMGYSVAIDGDTAVVGAYGVDHAGIDRGSAYVFTRSGTAWIEEQELTLNGQADGDWFGYRVAVNGDTAMIGALEAGAGHPDGRGSVYVFNRTGTFWSEGQKINGSGGADDRSFGISIQLEEGTLVIGSPGTDHSGHNNAGAAYVFAESAGTWTEIQRLTASDATDDAGFGVVSLAGNTMLVGADFAAPSGVYRAGAAYLFENIGGTWTERYKLVAASPESEARLGHSVAVTPEIALVGAPFTDSVAPLAGDAGAACFYDHASFVFTDGFESGGLTVWAASSGG